MRSIAIINQKGGVGKTTTAVNLSAGLAAAGKRVAIVDLDPQAHATLHFGIDPKSPRNTTYHLLTGDAEFASMWRTVEGGMKVAAAHIDLAAAEVELAGVVGREIILRDKLARITEDFDYLIIDCPPSIGLLTLNALAAVQDVFLPLQPHFLALHGLSKLMQTVGLVADRLNPSLHMAGVVLCLYDSGTRLAAEVTSDVEEYFTHLRGEGPVWEHVRLFSSRIRRNIRLAEAPSFGKSIFGYNPQSPGAADYEALTAEVLSYYAGRDAMEGGAVSAGAPHVSRRAA